MEVIFVVSHPTDELEYRTRNCPRAVLMLRLLVCPNHRHHVSVRLNGPSRLSEPRHAIRSSIRQAVREVSVDLRREVSWAIQCASWLGWSVRAVPGRFLDRQILLGYRTGK